MNAELRAAENRVRNSDASGIGHRDIYGYDVEIDLAKLGRAYLAEHNPSRSEPATAEWLEQVVSDYVTDGKGYASTCICPGRIIAVHDDGEWTLHGLSLWPGQTVTRGMVLRLIAALKGGG